MTAPAYERFGVTVYAGDSLDVLAGLPEASVHAVVTDPPYGIGFMGREWDQPGRNGSGRRGGSDRPLSAGAVGVDHLTTTERSASMHAGKYDLSLSAMQSFQAWCTAWVTECLRVLKPGGHLLAFGGSRTWHRLACAVEDAGFEIRDSIAWLYASGFPKSLDVSKAIDKAAGVEREVVGRKTLPDGQPRREEGPGTRADGSGWARPWQTDPAAIESRTHVTAPATDAARAWQGWGTALKPHPTVKPLALMRWLVRLVTPPGGTVLEPFLGSGTTAHAARAEGFECIGIERDESYLPLIRYRLDGDGGPDLFAGAS